MAANRIEIFFLGPGKIGLSLCFLLERAGLEVFGMWGRSEESLEGAAELIECPRFHGPIPPEISNANIIFITTVDSVIQKVATSLAQSGYLNEGASVFHCSGALDSSVLNSLRKPGCSAGTIHPLQAVPTIEAGIETLPGSFFALEGDRSAISIGRRLVEAIGGKALELPEGDRGVYHASASMASNYLITLIWSAARMMTNTGLKPEEALGALRPMTTNVLDMIDGLGAQQALTGPIARGDAETLKIQFEAVSEQSPGDLPLFLALARRTLDLAVESGGLSEDDIAELKKVMEEFDSSP